MRSCNCIWAAPEGYCELGEDPPFESNCPHWTERKDPITGDLLGPVHPAPERKEKVKWRSGLSK